MLVDQRSVLYSLVVIIVTITILDDDELSPTSRESWLGKYIPKQPQFRLLSCAQIILDVSFTLCFQQYILRSSSIREMGPLSHWYLMFLGSGQRELSTTGFQFWRAKQAGFAKKLTVHTWICLVLNRSLLENALFSLRIFHLQTSCRWDAAQHSIAIFVGSHFIAHSPYQQYRTRRWRTFSCSYSCSSIVKLQLQCSVVQLQLQLWCGVVSVV